MHLMSEKISHDDLHAGNILFKDGRCKIIDFGKSTVSESNQGDVIKGIGHVSIVGAGPSSFLSFSSLLFDAPTKLREAFAVEELSASDGMSSRWEIVFSGQKGPTAPSPVEMSVEEYRNLKLTGEVKVPNQDCAGMYFEKCEFSGQTPFYDALEDVKANCLVGRRPPSAFNDEELAARRTFNGWPIRDGKPFQRSVYYVEASSPSECADEISTMLQEFKFFRKFLPANVEIVFFKAYSAVTGAMLKQNITLDMLAKQDWYLRRVQPE